MGIRHWIAAITVAGCALIAGAQGTDTFTPMSLDSGFGRMDLTPPAVPPEQIIKEFSAKETEFQDALDHYTYRREAKVETLGDDNKVTGRVVRGGRCDLRSLWRPHGESSLCAAEHPGSGRGDDVSL